MPKIFEYLGIVIMFYSNEHEPIHIHGRQGDNESKVEFHIEDGEIVGMEVKTVRGRKPLGIKDMKNLNDFIEVYADAIVKKWVDYFINHRGVEFEKITKKL